MGRLIRKGVLFTLLFACPLAPASADPLLMFLLSVAKEMVANQIARDRQARPQLVLPDLSRNYPGTSVEPDQIRKVIDESFVYLGDSQRREIFDALHAALMDPRNAAVRGHMIDYFTDKALTVRAAQLQLAGMSSRQKERMVGEFKESLAGLTPEDAAQLGELLRSGLLPVPSDLNQMLLTAFEAPRAQ